MAKFDRDVDNIELGKASPMAALVVLGIIVVVIGLFASLKIVPAGHVGVLRLYGTEVTGEILPEGFHFRNPFKSTVSMSVQIQAITETAEIVSKDGLQISLDTTLLYRLNGESAPELLKAFLLDHDRLLVIPNLRSSVRNAGASYSSDALYKGETRKLIAAQIKEDLTVNLARYGFTVEDVLLRNIQFPPAFMQSLKQKRKTDDLSARKP